MASFVGIDFNLWFQGDRIRKRNDWMRWIMPPGKFSSLPSPQSQGKSGIDMLSAQVQSISLDQKTLNHSRSSSGDLSNLSPTCSSAGKDQVSIQGGGLVLQELLRGRKSGGECLGFFFSFFSSFFLDRGLDMAWFQEVKP